MSWNLVTKVFDVLGGGFVKEVTQTVKDYFPPGMSEQQKAELQIKITDQINQRENQLRQVLMQEQAEFNQRIKDLEGTAADLKTIPVLGPLVIFLRGSQRPIWGFATMYIDIMVFSNKWEVSDPTITSAFWVLNGLVLTFLFGERFLKNILPLVLPWLEARGMINKPKGGEDA